MSAISETYNHAHNILDFVYILPNVSFTVRRNVIITNKIVIRVDWRVGKRLKKISELHEIIV